MAVRDSSFVAACLVAGLLMLSGRSAQAAQLYRFTLNVQQSTVASDVSIEAPISGSVIGDFDPVSNPSGTQTRPGLFGGSGNQPIPMSITAVAAGGVDSHPSGSFSLSLESDFTFSITDLQIDLLNGSPGAINLILELFYSTFHTVSPSAIFPGGFVVPLPLGQVQISQFEMIQVQGSASSGVLVATGLNTFSFNAAILCDVQIQASALGQPIEFGSLQLPIVLSGSLDSATATPVLQTELTLGFGDAIKGPFPGGAFENFPLDLPTVLPPGQTAHLLFSGELTSIDFAFELQSSLNHFGWLVGDLHTDGRVDVDDLVVLLSQWGACRSAECQADLTHDGEVNSSDLQLLVDNWGPGLSAAGRGMGRSD